MSEGEMIESRLETSEDVTFDDYLKVMNTKLQQHLVKMNRCLLQTNRKLGLTEYGKNIGMLIKLESLLDWKNEDKLFNTLIKKSSDQEIFNKMEDC